MASFSSRRLLDLLDNLLQLLHHTCCFTLHFYVTEMASFLQSHEPSSVGFNLPQLPHLSQPSQNCREWVRALLCIRLWLKGMLWLLGFSLQTTTTLSMSAVRRFHFPVVGVFTGVALSSKNFPLVLTAWLIAWHSSPSFQSVSAFDMPSSLNLIISSFWIKLRDVRLCLSLEHLNASIGLLTGLISVLLHLREQGGPRRGRETGTAGRLAEQSEHTHILLVKLAVLHGCGLTHPKTITVVTSKITDHRSPWQIK